MITDVFTLKVGVLVLDNVAVFYPGIGAPEAISELNKLVGQITATWAQVEDGLFEVFVIAIAGTFHVPDLTPYRAVFFTFSSFQAKMRMTQNAMRARFGQKMETMEAWKRITDPVNQFADLRNSIAHLIPMAKSSNNPMAEANVRLVPAFWRGLHQNNHDFDKSGYSIEELWHALSPFWGFHPRIHGTSPPSGETAFQLSFRIQQFAKTLTPPPSPAGDETVQA